VTEPQIRTTRVDAPVREATLLEDRAQVLRRGGVELPPGRHELVVAGLSPVVADRTVRCRLRGTPSAPGAPGADVATVQDVRVLREYVLRPARPERERELTAAIEAAVDEYLAGHDRLATLLAERRLLVAAGNATSRAAGDRLLAGAFDPATAAEVDALFRRRAELEAQALDAGFGQEDRLERIDRLRQEQAAALATLVSECRASAVVTVEVAGAARCELELEYLVPCALWRPEYAAELAREQPAPLVRWSSGGTAWQATGEDWRGIALSCSTARPALGAELPLLEDDVLVSRPKSDQERKTIEVTSRDQSIATTGEVPPRASDTPPGVDDGGEVRTYRVPGAVDLPSDGRPHRFTFETWEAAAECERMAAPSRAPWVFLRSLQANPSAMPLLAGPVTLVRSGGFIGRSEVSYVAPGERFELSWGSEDGLVVLREEARSLDETLLRKAQRHAFDVKVYLANHGAEPAKVRLVERVPVSELAQVEVAVKAEGTTPGFEQDAQGLVSWVVDLPPRGEATVQLAFEVAMPAHVRWEG
jgi:uncharacterized protein (TIGR02231 family)